VLSGRRWWSALTFWVRLGALQAFLNQQQALSGAEGFTALKHAEVHHRGGYQ